MKFSRKCVFLLVSLLFGFAVLRAEPGIRVHSDARVLEAPSASKYQWYHNGAPIAGETGQILKVRGSGVYTVSYSDRFGQYVEESVRVEVSEKKIVRVFLIGDSTVADYTIYDDYKTKRYPITGWGQVFQAFMSSDSLIKVRNIIKADSVLVIDSARGGRSTRTFFEEGRWASVYHSIQPNDLVLIQFGHNDAAKDKPERYVTVQGYKEYLRLYVNQVREKGAIPILLTPVNRNYPWADGKLMSVHGEYPDAVKQVAKELNVRLIDLTQLSCDFFTSKGQEYVTGHYFMNLPAGAFEAYPDGQKDNTHFQPEGAVEVARLVFEALQGI